MNRLPFILLWLPGVCLGQSVGNVHAAFQNGKVTVTYGISGGNEKQTYNVALYSSYDNFAQPLVSVTGDVGNNKTGGPAKSIVWDATTDLGEYKGPLTFRVVAVPLAMPYSFIQPAMASSYRRGKQAEIRWEGGLASDDITIELLKEGTVLRQLSGTKNSGAQNWAVPKDMQKGPGYSLRLKSSTGQSITSNVFSIKSKVPLALKVAPLLVVGGLVAVLVGGGGGPGPEPNNGNDLPVAPSAPN